MAGLGKDSIKLLMQWDIKADREQDYFEFVVREWVPGITRLGLEPTGAWFTAYSRDKASQIMTEGITEDLDTMRRILKSAEWQQLHDKLLEFVSDYEQRVVRVSGDFQL